ncbi:hypothetical protein QTP86_005697 [Hemibagrus guttatus]|nr:hypothetical protein QTP86_005697 [Hemibagrus guttatus]
MLRELVNVAGSDLSRAEDLAARMGLRSRRVVNQLLHHWSSALTSEERVQLMGYQHTETGPAEDEPFPRLNIAPDLDGCAGPLLECRSDGEMDFGSVSGKLLYRACVKENGNDRRAIWSSGNKPAETRNNPTEKWRERNSYFYSVGVMDCLLAYPTNPRVHFTSSHVTRSDSMQREKRFRIQEGAHRIPSAGTLQTETRNMVFVGCDTAVCGDVSVHQRNVQMSRMTSVRS